MKDTKALSSFLLYFFAAGITMLLIVIAAASLSRPFSKLQEQIKQRTAITTEAVISADK